MEGEKTCIAVPSRSAVLPGYAGPRNGFAVLLFVPVLPDARSGSVPGDGPP